VNITVFTKEKCSLCASLKEKLVLMGKKFKVRDIEYLTELHEGWRDDGSVEVLAGHALVNRMIPMVQIGKGYFNYTGSMRELKRK